MSNKVSNIKTLADINNKTSNNALGFITQKVEPTKKPDISQIIKMLSDEQNPFERQNVETVGKALGGNKTRDIRKARLSYNDNLSKNTPTAEK